MVTPFCISTFSQEDKPFVVTNTENFGFLKADYKKKMESANSAKPPLTLKRNSDGLILLSSGIFLHKKLSASKVEIFIGQHKIILI